MMEDKEQDDALYELASLIAAYSNPHMFTDLKDFSEEECLRELEALKNMMGEMIG